MPHWQLVYTLINISKENHIFSWQVTDNYGTCIFFCVSFDLCTCKSILVGKEGVVSNVVFYFLFVCVTSFLSVPCECRYLRRINKSLRFYPVELQLQLVLSSLVQMLGNEPMVSGRAACALTHWAILQFIKWNLLISSRQCAWVIYF